MTVAVSSLFITCVADINVHQHLIKMDRVYLLNINQCINEMYKKRKHLSFEKIQNIHLRIL